MGITRTKIICTIGPATKDLAVLRKLYKAGMNVVRFAPSLVIPDEDILEGLACFERGIAKVVAAETAEA